MDDSQFVDLLAAVTEAHHARLTALTRPAQTLHRWILRHFADTASAPHPQVVKEWGADLDADTGDLLAVLVGVDLVEADPEELRIDGAYPFAGDDRGHHVEIAGGPAVHAYCAIDALGIPSMLGRDAAITSADPRDGQTVRVDVHNGQARWRPDGAVVSLPLALVSTGQPAPLGDVCCPSINFYAGDHGLDLEALTMSQALRCADAIFGDLLKP